MSIIKSAVVSMTSAQHEFWANKLCSLEPQSKKGLTDIMKTHFQPHDFNAIMDMHTEFSNHWKQRANSKTVRSER